MDERRERAHTKVKVSFGCWTNNIKIVCYKELCTKFGEIVDWVVDDETQYCDTANWFDCKKNEVKQTFIKAKEAQKLKAKQPTENVEEIEHEDYDLPDILVHNPIRKPRQGCPRMITNPKRRTKKKDG